VSQDLSKLREAVEYMAQVEDNGEQYIDDDYEAYAEMIGMKLSDRMGCWTYSEGEALTAGSDMVQALDQYEKTGKLPGLTVGDMLSNLAVGLGVNLD
jgi:hypothetical protein